MSRGEEKKVEEEQEGGCGRWDTDFIRGPCVNSSPPGQSALFPSLHPAQSSCHERDLLGRQPPVGKAGQGLSKDKGTFWCIDRLTGWTPWCVCACVCVSGFFCVVRCSSSITGVFLHVFTCLSAAVGSVRIKACWWLPLWSVPRRQTVSVCMYDTALTGAVMWWGRQEEQ